MIQSTESGALISNVNSMTTLPLYLCNAVCNANEMKAVPLEGCNG